MKRTPALRLQVNIKTLTFVDNVSLFDFFFSLLCTFIVEHLAGVPKEIKAFLKVTSLSVFYCFDLIEM